MFSKLPVKLLIQFKISVQEFSEVEIISMSFLEVTLINLESIGIRYDLHSKSEMYDFSNCSK